MSANHSPSDKSMGMAPRAIETIKSYRGWGYDLSTALADLIDNSISANARTVKIRFEWAGDKSTVSILDDGDGMTAERLDQAMHIGADPDLARDATDLGRFGLGLKTASWSQCDCLTVCSKNREGQQAIARWDADHVEAAGDWQLLHQPRPGSESLLEPMASREHGTLVVWEGLHAAAQEADMSDQRFWEQVSLAEQHLGMVFHRFIEQRRLTIMINDGAIAPFDPLLALNPNRIPTPEENLWLDNQAVLFSGVIMPPRNRFSPKEFEDAAGPRGWLEGQGFYVYRLDRIVIAGGWLGLGRAGKPWSVDQQHILARIALDIPNSMDSAWQLSIRKHGATPPEAIRERLLKLAQTVRRRAQAVAAGDRATGKPKPISDTPWAVVGAGAALQYSVNRKHPAVLQVIASANDGGRAARALLELLDKTAPMQPVGPPVDVATEVPAQVPADERLVRLVSVVWLVNCVPNGLSLQDLRVRLTQLPEFHDRPELIDLGIERIKSMGNER